MTTTPKPNKYVPAIGPRDAKIMIVGEAPGPKEELDGIPFVGYSGTLLRYTFERCGIDPAKLFITNVCHYRPPRNDINAWCPKSRSRKHPGRQPNDLVAEGMAELYRDIADIQPNVIIPVGNVALWSLTGFEQIGRRRGSIMVGEIDVPRAMHVASRFDEAEISKVFRSVNGRKIVPTFHPAAVTRQYTLKPIFEFDIKRAAREARSPDVSLPDRRIYIDPVGEDLARIVDGLLSADQMACDIETPNHQLFCCSFCVDPSWALVLTTRTPLHRQVMRTLLESDVPKIFQNGNFDTSFLRMHEGINVRHYLYDTMLAQRICYAEFKIGLDFQTTFYTREPYYKHEGKHKTENDNVSVKDIENYLRYNGKDACVTLECAVAQQGQEMRDPRNQSIMVTAMSEAQIVTDIMARGIRIDSAALKRHKRAYREKLEKDQTTLDDTVLVSLAEIGVRDTSKQKTALELGLRVAKDGFNVSSPKDCKTYLYTLRGFKPKTKKNKFGANVPTTDEKALKELYGETKDGVLLNIVNVRKHRKMLGSYLNFKPGFDGRFHFAVNPAGTKTRRWSTGKTVHGWGLNAQTWPPEIRDILIADDGYVLFYADLSQVEDRVVAYMGRVLKKMHAFENNIDAHALTASGIFNTTIEAVLKQSKEFKLLGKTPPMRYLGKQSNHAYNYGEREKTFMQNVNKRADETNISITLAESKKIRVGHFRLYPEIETNYWAEIQDELQRTRTLVTPFGFKRVFHDRLGDDLFRDAYSWKPQATAPEIIRRGMVRIERELALERKHDVIQLLNVHDAILGQVRENLVDEMRTLIPQLMNIPVPIKEVNREIHIPVDIAFGHNWKELG
jgi:uracil-DNA glycosylase